MTQKPPIKRRLIHWLAALTNDLRLVIIMIFCLDFRPIWIETRAINHIHTRTHPKCDIHPLTICFFFVCCVSQSRGSLFSRGYFLRCANNQRLVVVVIVIVVACSPIFFSLLFLRLKNKMN